MKKFLKIGAIAGLALAATAVLFYGPALSQNVVNFIEQGGARTVIGGSLDVVSGGDLDIESGGIFSIGGVTVAATAAELDTMNGITATTAELNLAADNSANVEIVAATNVIIATESGKTFFLNDSTEFISTLPAPASGLRYTFIVTAAPASASYTVVTNASANIMTVILTAGGIDDASDVAVARDVVTFVDAQSVPGDWMECISDATNWFCRGSAAVAAGITTGQSG